MKKLVFIMLGVIALVSCGNNDVNIENDVNNAFENLEKYTQQCADKYCNDYYFHYTNKGMYEADFVIGSIERTRIDANNIVKKVFDPLFEKYGNEKALKGINEYSYNNNYEWETKTQKDSLYKHLSSGIIDYVSRKVCDVMDKFN